MLKTVYVWISDDCGGTLMMHVTHSNDLLFSYFHSWDIAGSELGNACGLLHSQNSMVFAGANDRYICTPFVDATNVGNLRFYFSMGE